MTKKILSLIVLATLFVACGDDKDEYYNPVEGRWVYVYSDGEKETRVYNNKFEVYGIYLLNGTETIEGYGNYSVDNKHIYMKEATHEYKIENDTLWLTNQVTDWKRKYIREK